MLRELDLNLLYVLVALENKRSVSAAAVSLGKSQPSVSASLAKLRQFFDDPLYVRSGNSMQPTPRADVLIEAARQVLEKVGADIVSTPTFDAKTTHQTINIALSDVEKSFFCRPCCKDLRRHAPNALVRSVSLPAADVAEGLETGSIDLAVGYFPDLKKSNFFQQVLFTDTFSSLVRLDHPLTARKLSTKQYLELEHAVVHAESRTEEVMERISSAEEDPPQSRTLDTALRERPDHRRAIGSDRDRPGAARSLFRSRVRKPKGGRTAVRAAAHSAQTILASKVSSRPAQHVVAIAGVRAVPKAGLRSCDNNSSPIDSKVTYGQSPHSSGTLLRTLTLSNICAMQTKSRHLLIACIAGLLQSAASFATNPLIMDQFTADPTARVFEGKIYVYPSHDIKAPPRYKGARTGSSWRTTTSSPRRISRTGKIMA